MDIANSVGRSLLADKIKADINEYCRVTYDDGPRSHLGASELADPCPMRLWLIFRWAYASRFDGRMQRLLNRGRKEEARFVEWLRGTGWIVNEYEPGTQNQIRIKFSEGHGGGSLDGEMAHKDYTAGEIVLAEFKTYGQKQFDKLVKDKVQKAKLKHWGQMCSYGAKRKIQYAVYFGICKNTDDLHIEVLELDWRLGEELFARGEQIVLSQTPPQRLSDNPQWRDCLYCDKYPVCHGGEKVDVNCRSCRHAQPIKNGEWHCNFFNMTIPKDFLPKGCENHFPIIGP